MKLPFLGSFGKKEVKNYYLALLLQDEKIGAVILEEIEGRIHVVASAEEHFSTSLEKASFEEWLNNIDKAVSLAENNLPEEIQTEKTVFGVKQDWVEDGKIKKEYLIKLKKVCDELELKPIGFLVFTEAIVHLLQQEEGAPVSAILVEVGKKFLTISLIRAGRIVQTQLTPMEEKITIDVDKALKHFETEILPARIILYDSENNEKLSQSFISHSWSKSLPFLHVPQITVLPVNFDTKGVLYGTATQLGFEVFGEQAIPSRTIGTKKAALEEEEAANGGPEENKLVEEKEKELEEPQEQGPEPAEEPTDVTLLDEIEEEEVKDQEKVEKTGPLETVNSEYFGFVENKDIVDIEGKNFPKPKKENADGKVFEEIPQDVKNEETDFEKPTGEIGTQSALLFQGIKKGFNSALKSTPKIKAGLSAVFSPFSKFFRKKRQGPENRRPTPLKTIIALLVILVGITGIILLYVFAISAQVNIAVTPMVTQDTSPVTFAVDGQSNFDNNQIAAKTISQNEDGNLSQDTTGTKQVGTQAKGQVTIFSRLTSTTTLKKGTVITASNDLEFTLDSDTQVASFSGDTTDPSITVANVSVTAKDIGPEYNIPSGTKFNIDGLDKTDVSAKNDNPFTGGTKKDISIVSQDDVDKLTSTLTKNLESQAQNDMKKTLSGTQELLPFFAQEDVVKKTLTNNVGDEAKSVSLDATVSYEGVIVDKNDLISFAKQVLKDKITQDADMENSKLETALTDTKQDKDTISGTLAIKASILPKIDKNQIGSDISGKSFAEAQSLIKNIPQVSGVVIQLQPNLPFLPKILPRISDHINIKILTDE